MSVWETRCYKIRLKPDSLDRVRAWAAELNRRQDEVLATLHDEDVVVESAFLDSTGEGDFLIYHIKARSIAGANDVARRSPHAIDAYHARFKADTWETGQRLDLLIDFDRIGEGVPFS